MTGIAARIAALPRLVRFIAANAAAGALLGCLAAGALLWLDAGGLGGLFARSDHAPAARIPLFILYFGSFAVTFATGFVGTAVWLHGGEGE